MNKLINIVLSGLLWRRYKFLLVSLVITVVLMIVIGQVHQDYLAYNALLEHPKFVGGSFAIKWALWCVFILAFLFLNNWYNNKKQAEKERESGGSNHSLNKLMGRFSKKSSGVKDKPSKQDSFSPETSSSEASTKSKSSKDCTSPEHDPFSAIRNKEKLRSYAEVIIDNKKS